jgi:hypothetical protein
MSAAKTFLINKNLHFFKFFGILSILSLIYYVFFVNKIIIFYLCATLNCALNVYLCLGDGNLRETKIIDCENIRKKMSENVAEFLNSALITWVNYNNGFLSLQYLYPHQQMESNLINLNYIILEKSWKNP